MSSEAESKDETSAIPARAWGSLLWLFIGCSFFGTIFLVFKNLGTSLADEQIVLSRRVYDELLVAIEMEHGSADLSASLKADKIDVKSATGSNCNCPGPGRNEEQQLLMHAAAQQTQLLQQQNQQLRAELAVLKAHVEAAPQVAAQPAERPGDDDYCDVSKIRLGYDARFIPKSTEIKKKLSNKAYPTFEEMYFLVVNSPWDEMNNVWNSFPNPYKNMKANFHFPFSNLHENNVQNMFNLLGRPPKFSVEVGSFHGHSAIMQAKMLDKNGFTDTPLLCIDPWTGDLGMVLFRDDWEKKLTPGEIQDGRSTSYFQFMLNVKQQIEQKAVGPKHIVPLAVTSVVGARFLMAVGLTPDTIYLDSAHEIDETYTELTLFFSVLAKGGVIMGDDFTWESVSHDVKRFCRKHNLKLINEGVTWMIKKPE